MVRWFSKLGCLACLLWVNAAHAHFVWIVPGPSAEQARVLFAEGPANGEAELVDKIAATKAWTVPAEGEARTLDLKKETKDEFGWWSAKCGAGDVVEAHCDYGDLERDGKKFQLTYDAKCIPVSRLAKTGKLVISARLPFDIAVSKVETDWTLQAIYAGKPVPKAEFTIYETNDDSKTIVADDEGRMTLKLSIGQHPVAVRVKYTRPLAAAKETDPTEARHYATLVFAPSPTVASPTVELTAAELLVKARADRAVWKDFHGFRADFTVHVDDQSARGKIVVDENGEVLELDLSEPALRKWLLLQISSMVQHRLPSFDAGREAKYADESPNHPFGRKIILGDEKLQSVYRIKDNVVTEVNRRAGNTRFTISVLEIERNPEGKYLPRMVSITTWDNKTNEVQSAQSVSNTWQRIGSVDLPARLVEIESGPNLRSVKEFTLSNPKLTPAASAKASK